MSLLDTCSMLLQRIVLCWTRERIVHGWNLEGLYEFQHILLGLTCGKLEGYASFCSRPSCSFQVPNNNENFVEILYI